MMTETVGVTEPFSEVNAYWQASADRSNGSLLFGIHGTSHCGCRAIGNKQDIGTRASQGRGSPSFPMGG